MLVLTRKKDEEIVIPVKVGDRVELIVVEIVEVRGDKVRLGVSAPPEIPVHRREVYEAICQAENAVRKAVSNGTQTT